MQFIWALIAASVAVLSEYLYRVIKEPWVNYIWYWIPSQVVTGFAIYKLVTSSDSLLSAMVFWAFGTAILRTCVTLYLGDRISTGTWIAFGLIMLANCVKLWEQL